jgi:hypothetical protein
VFRGDVLIVSHQEGVCLVFMVGSNSLPYAADVVDKLYTYGIKVRIGTVTTHTLCDSPLADVLVRVFVIGVSDRPGQLHMYHSAALR